MRLNMNVIMLDFMHAVSQCVGDVFFITPEGDMLNLKSELSKYVFAVIAAQPQKAMAGEVVCKNSSDTARILPYVIAD